MTDAADKPHQQGISTQIPPEDRAMFDQMSREQLYGYIFMQVKNIWRVDGLYFLGIEKRRGMQEATDVDADCWRYMGKTEAKELKNFLGVSDCDPVQALWLLRHTSWAVSHHVKDFSENQDGSTTFIVDQCRTQLIRQDKGLGPHPCRQVREGYLQAFVTELSPGLALETVSCPPDRTRQDVWCEWRIYKK